jgi:hypothetical protein
MLDKQANQRLVYGWFIGLLGRVGQVDWSALLT